MKLAAWMKERKLDDATVAAMLKRDRATINRIRRGSHRPSWLLVIDIERLTKGKVKAKDWI